MISPAMQVGRGIKSGLETRGEIISWRMAGRRGAYTGVAMPLQMSLALKLTREAGRCSSL